MAESADQELQRLRRVVGTLRNSLQTCRRLRAEQTDKHAAHIERLRSARDGFQYQRDQLRARLDILAEDGTHGRYSGCYLLMKLGVPVYVGQSINLFGRIATHRSVNSWPTRGDFDEVRLIWCAPDELDATEQRLIEELKPLHNRAGVTRPFHRASRSREQRLPADLSGPVHTTIAQQEVAA